MLERIRELCRLRGVTIAELERECGIANSVVCKWDKVSPRLDKVIAVADFLGVSLDYLVKGEEAGKYAYPAIYASLRPEDKALIDKLIESLTPRQ